MQPTEHQYIKQGTAPVETVRMGIDPNSAEFLMNVFTDLYSDTMMAPIREYISNALDSHTEAGQTRPIDVRKPSALRPFFEVEDYGIGMSLETIRRVYSLYGYSTKRHSDDYVGMLGVGSKSGLTYSNSFNITSVHDGTLVHFTISRGNKGDDGQVSGNGADVDIHRVTPTDKPNGVKVQLPVADISTFARKVDEFVQYARPGSIKVDGVLVEGRISGATKVNDNVYIMRDDYGGGHRQDVVVAGGVPYRAGKNLSKELPYGTYAVAYVPVGTVEFTPSREDLSYTRKTEAALAHIRGIIKRDLQVAALADIQGAASHFEAWQRYINSWVTLVSGSVTYKGVALPTRNLYVEPFLTYDINRYRQAVSSGRQYASPNTLKQSIIIQNFENKTLTGNNRTKVRQYIEQQGLKDIRYVFIQTDDEPLLSPWTDDIPVCEWADIKAIKLPRAASGTSSPKSEPEIDVYSPASPRADKRTSLPYSQVPAGDILLVSPGDLTPDYYHEVMLPDLQTIYPTRTIVVIASNRFDKFEREYDGRDILRWSRNQFALDRTAFVDGLSADQKRVLFGNNYKLSIFEKMDAANVQDKDVANLIDLLNKDVSGIKLTWGAFQRIGRATVGFDRPQVDDHDLFEKYPLLEHVSAGWAAAKAAEQYINLIHKEQS